MVGRKVPAQQCFLLLLVATPQVKIFFGVPVFWRSCFYTVIYCVTTIYTVIYYANEMSRQPSGFFAIHFAAPCHRSNSETRQRISSPVSAPWSSASGPLVLQRFHNNVGELRGQQCGQATQRRRAFTKLASRERLCPAGQVFQLVCYATQQVKKFFGVPVF